VWVSEVDKNQSSSSAEISNGASTESDTDVETETGSGSGSGSDSDSDYKYHDNAKMKIAEHSPDDAGFANNDDTEISEDMNNLTLVSELIIFKQKMFTSFQFLVQKKTELHV